MLPISKTTAAGRDLRTVGAPPMESLISDTEKPTSDKAIKRKTVQETSRIALPIPPASFAGARLSVCIDLLVIAERSDRLDRGPSSRQLDTESLNMLITMSLSFTLLLHDKLSSDATAISWPGSSGSTS